MQESTEASRRRRGYTPDTKTAASIQLTYWLAEQKQIATGTYHYREPKVRPGQWVRFIGDSKDVQVPAGRAPRVGDYGQVWERIRGQHRVIVVFLGNRGLFRLSPYELEPLVGTPLDRPRDHLRYVKRRVTAHRRVAASSREAR
jgi:hypothetical protein